MATRGPRLEFAVGAFLVLALASVLVLAVASTNGKFGFARDSYELTARFTNLGQLRPNAPVKVGGTEPVPLICCTWVITAVAVVVMPPVASR